VREKIPLSALESATKLTPFWLPYA
jgi:hypothetical protein